MSCNASQLNTEKKSVRKFDALLKALVYTTALFALLQGLATNQKNLIGLSIVPLVYGVLYLSLARFHFFAMEPGKLMVNLVFFARYFLIPGYTALFSGELPFHDKYLDAVGILLFEEIVLGLVIVFYSRRKKPVKFPAFLKIPDTRTHIVYYLLFLLAAISLALNPEILDLFNILLISQATHQKVYFGIEILFVEWAKMILPIVLISGLVSSYWKSHDTKKVIIGPSLMKYLFAMVIVLFINVLVYRGLSRNTIIYPGLASLFFLLKVFPERRRQTILILGLSLVFALLWLTLYKNSFGTSTSNLNTPDKQLNYFSMYFMGPNDVAASLHSYDLYRDQFTLRTLLNDLFYNIPGISHLLDGANRTNTFYNLTRETNSLAIALPVQGLYYVGPFMYPAISALILTFVFYLDNLYIKEKSLLNSYLFAYFSIYIAASSVTNISNLSRILIVIVLPFLVLMKLLPRVGELLSKVKNKNKEYGV